MATFLAFDTDSDQLMSTLAILGAASIIVLVITHTLAWLVDRRGDRLVTR